MIIDSSAMVAMLWKEPEAAPFLTAIIAAGGGSISAGNYLEASIVIDKQRNSLISAGLDNLLAELQISVAPVTATQAHLARQAYRDFGKGSGHPAQLNFGDCFAYALAVERGESLLYKGDDFAKAGLERVVGA